MTELCVKALQEMIKLEEPPPLVERVRLATEISYGMAFLHEMNIVHRDLKPGNVLLDSQAGVKVRRGVCCCAGHLVADMPRQPRIACLFAPDL